MTRSLRALAALTLATASGGCSRAADPAPALVVPAPPEPASPGPTPWPAGALRAPEVRIAFGLRLVGGQKAAAGVATLRKLAARHLPGVAIFDLEKGPPAPPAPALGLGSMPAEPLPPQALRYFGRGLDAAAQARTAKAWPTAGLVLAVEGAKADAALRSVTALVAEAARSLGAVVDDPEARLYYSARAFADDVARDGFDGGVPVVIRHVGLHSYEKDGGELRSISVGMSKLGLPDLVVNGHALGGGAALRNLMAVVAQTMAERGRVDAAGRIDVDLRSLRAGELRRLADELKKGGTGRASVGIAEGKLEQGDAENRLVELTFAGKPGGPVERQNAVLAEVFGAEDPLVYVKHDDALRAESARANARFLALEPGWAKRRAEGEQLMVKAPFRTRSGESEYMWVEVTAWKGKKLRGLLANDPYEVPDLRAGATVEVETTAVFDYLVRRPDGTTEGNTTERFLPKPR